MVYDDAEKLYAEVRTDTEALTEDALRVIYPGSCALSSASSEPQTLFAHNTTPFARRDIVRVSNSTANVLQATSDEKEGYVVMEGGPGGGLVLPSQISVQDLRGVTAESTNGEHFVLKNENVRLTVSGGRITSLFDVKLRCVSFLCIDPRLIVRSRRELIPHGETGGLVIFEDIPNYWDAWGALTPLHVLNFCNCSLDVEIHHLEKAERLKFSNVKVVASGPLRASVVSVVEYGKSRITTTVSANPAQMFPTIC